MSRQRITAASLVLTVFLAGHAWAETRQETILILEGIGQGDSLGLEAWLNTNTPFQIQVGDEVGFRFRSATDVYLTTLYVDANGAVIVLHSGDEQLLAESELAFPQPSSDQRMIALVDVTCCT